MEKKCFKCGEVKPLDDFYKHPQMGDGHVNKCKECNKKDVQENYQLKREHYANYEKERFKNPERKAYAVKAHRHRKEHSPDKYKAHIMVGNAIRDGRLTRSSCCICGEEKVEGHHEDYSKPLEVVWLCRTHHLATHNKKSYKF